MSLEFNVYCNRAKLPTGDAWAAAIVKEGFDWTFKPAVNWRTRHGFQPVLLMGEDTGFELDLFSNDPDDYDEDEPLPKAATKFDSVVAFRFGTQGLEPAMLAAGTLARLTRGYLLDTEDHPCSAAGAIKNAKELLAPKPPKQKKTYKWSWDDPNLRPAAWAKQCLVQLQLHVHPDYRQLDHGRDNLLEFVREDKSTGLLYSQNMLRRRTLGEDEYTHCFAVLLSPSPIGNEGYAPLFAGGRWEHYYSVAMQFRQDLLGGKRGKGHPAKPKSETTNFRQIVHNARAAETYLFPHYRKRLKAGAPKLIQLFSFASKTMAKLPPKARGLAPGTAVKAAGIDVKTYNRHRDDCRCSNAIGMAFPHPEATPVPEGVRDVCLLGNNAGAFWSARDEIPGILDKLRRLGGKRR